MKRITQTKEIQTGDNSGIVVSGDEKISYSSEFELVDYDLDDLITKRAAQDLVNESDPSSVLKPWVPDDPTKTDEYRSYVIDDIEYLFRSNVDDNVSVPTLSGGGETVWEKTNELYFPQQYLDFTTYPEGRIVWDYQPGEDPPVFIAYRSLQNGNLDNAPNFDADTEWWEKIGVYASPFVFTPGTIYPEGAVVVDDTDSDRIYISKVSDNDNHLDYIVPGTIQWQVTGLYKKITTVDESVLIEESYGDMWYLPVDLAGKKLLSVEITQGDITTYRGPESLSNDVAWSLPRISGFPNNDPQTIKITTL